MLFDNYFNYWSYFGLIYLIFLAWQDFRHKNSVDDRLNFFMMGVTISLISHIKTRFIYVIALSIFAIVTYYLFQKTKVYGQADINSFVWIFTGFGIIDSMILMFFIIFLFCVSFLLLILRRFIFKRLEYIPFYGIILIDFICCSIIFHAF